MIEDLDIYVLVENATISSLKEFVAKWAQGLDAPSEYLVTLPNDSFLEFDNIEDFLVHVLRENVHAVLYWTANHWTGDNNYRSEMDSVFIFFNEDGSVIVGIGVRFKSVRKAPFYNEIEALPYFKELVADLNVIAGYVTAGVPADSKQAFLSVAQQSEPPKVWDGIVIEN